LAEERIDVADRCDDLVGQLDRLLDPPPEPTWGALGDGEIPF
jgi:hypothetical protein